MTERQERFCQEFVRTGNASASAVASGYSERSARQIGQRLLTNDDIKRRIKELNGEIKNEKIIDARKMQEVLTDIILGKAVEEVIVVEGCGDGVSEAVTKEKKPTNADRIKACQLLARMQGQLDNSITVDVIVPQFGGEDELED